MIVLFCDFFDIEPSSEINPYSDTETESVAKDCDFEFSVNAARQMEGPMHRPKQLVPDGLSCDQHLQTALGLSPPLFLANRCRHPRYNWPFHNLDGHMTELSTGEPGFVQRYKFGPCDV